MWQTTCTRNVLTGRKLVRDGCGDWLFMTPTLNDSTGTFLLIKELHSSDINEQQKGEKCKWGDWETSQTDGETEKGERQGGNYHHFDEWGLWQRPAGDRSVTETGFCGPNFIIMTQSHQHSAPDKTRAETNSGKDHLKWSVFTGLSQSGLHSGIQPLAG